MSRANPLGNPLGNLLRRTWQRALLVVVTIPALWAGQLWVGLSAARFPKQIFGEAASAGTWFTAAVPVLIGVAVLWIMVKTPFVALSWALREHDDEEVEKQ